MITTLNLPARLKTLGTREDYEMLKLSGDGDTSRVINLASGNKYFVKEDGVLYDINKTKIYIADGSVTSYTMPDSVTTVCGYAFAGTSITEFSFNSNITTIPYGCFQDCQSLQTIAIQSHITKIDITAFYCCFNLKTVVISSNVNKIGMRAFAHTAVTSITFANTTGWYVTSSSSYNNGESIDVSAPSTNATNLNTGIWYAKYLYRS